MGIQQEVCALFQGKGLDEDFYIRLGEYLAENPQVEGLFAEVLSGSARETLVYLVSKVFRHEYIDWRTLLTLSKVYSKGGFPLKNTRFVDDDFERTLIFLEHLPANDLILLNGVLHTNQFMSNMLTLIRSKLEIGRKEILLLSLYCKLGRDISTQDWLNWKSLSITEDTLLGNIGDIAVCLQLKMAGKWDSLMGLNGLGGESDAVGFLRRYGVSEVSLRQLGLGLADGSIDRFAVWQYVQAGIPVRSVWDWTVIAGTGQDPEKIRFAIKEMKSLEIQDLEPLLDYLSEFPLPLQHLGDMRGFWLYFNEERQPLIDCLAQNTHKLRALPYHPEFTRKLMNLSTMGDWEGKAGEDLSAFLDFARKGMSLLLSLSRGKPYGFNNLVFGFNKNLPYFELMLHLYGNEGLGDKYPILKMLKSRFKAEDMPRLRDAWGNPKEYLKHLNAEQLNLAIILELGK